MLLNLYIVKNMSKYYIKKDELLARRMNYCFIAYKFKSHAGIYGNLRR